MYDNHDNCDYFVHDNRLKYHLTPTVLVDWPNLEGCWLGCESDRHLSAP